MASFEDAKKSTKLVFSTDQFPKGLDDRERFRLWLDWQEQFLSSLDVTYGGEHPFWARMEFARFGACGVGQYAGAFRRVNRTARSIARDGNDNFALALNRGRSPVSMTLRGRELVVTPGSATLVSYADTGTVQLAPGFTLLEVALPRQSMMQLVPDAEDLVVTALSSEQPSIRYLRHYVDILREGDDFGDEPLLASHIEATLTDLVALALGTGRDGAAIASMRGLRAARLRSVLFEIKRSFTDPNISAATVGRRLGLSPRYIQALLHEIGATFSERVLELRLQKARTMLACKTYAHWQASQIAYACGFNQVGYFNRCFRRRFGTTPTAARQGARLI